jgi:hypothetical protein
MQYRCVAITVEGFVQQLAGCLLPHGYWFYVAGRIPPHKDPERVDAKLIARYGIDLSKRERARRKQRGYANLHYLRYERFFVLLATKGEHRFERGIALTAYDQGQIRLSLPKSPLRPADIDRLRNALHKAA